MELISIEDMQIGAYIYPDQNDVPQLIANPIIKAIYLHHKISRISPFVNGNVSVTRVAKNWMLIYDLYPPIFINNASKKYYATLSKSFRELDNSPKK